MKLFNRDCIYMNEFKKCPNGHYYQGDECPFCSNDSSNKKDDSKMKVCANQHAYDYDLDVCPFCGDSKVDTIIDGDEERLLIYKMFIVPKNNGELIRITYTTKSGIATTITIFEFDKSLTIDVGLLGNFILYYSFDPDSFKDYKGIIPEVEDCAFEIGEDKMTSKDFIAKIDELMKKEIGINGRIDVSKIDLNEIYKRCVRGHLYKGVDCPYCCPKEIQITKVCPKGHGYSGKEETCPFCGDEIVVQTLKETLGVNNTLWYSDLWYEKDGLQVHDLKAFVDGRIITGEICLRVYHTFSYKYDYCVAIDRETELSVSPKSKVVLQGSGFSDTYTGIEFYKICDLLFDKKEHI